MSALNIIGGIGQGLMQGSQFVANERQRKEDNTRADQLMSMREQQFGWQQTEHERKQKDLADQDWMNEQYRTIYAREDLDEYGKAQEYAKTILPRAKPEHVEAAKKATEALYQNLGVKGVDALARGDISVLQRLAGAKAPGTQIALTGDGKKIIVMGPNGDMLQELDRSGILSMLELTKAQETLTARALAEQKWRKEEGLIENKDEHTNYLTRIPVVGGSSRGGVKGSGGGGSGGKGAVEKPYDVIGSFHDYNQAWGKPDELGEGQQQFDRARGFEIFNRLIRYNPTQMQDAPGQSVALRLSRDIQMGNARLSPEIDAETGQMALVATAGDHRFVYEPNVSDERLMKMTGFDGKPLAATSEAIGKIREDAIKRFAASSPENNFLFNAAATVVNTPEKLAEVRSIAASGGKDAEIAKATLRLVPLVQKYAPYAQSIPVKGTNKPTTDKGFVANEKERAAAQKYDVDLDRKGLGDYAGELGDYIASKVRGIGDAMDRNFVANTLKKIRSTEKIEQGEAKAIVAQLRANPELVKVFSDEEIWAIQASAQERI